MRWEICQDRVSAERGKRLSNRIDGELAIANPELPPQLALGTRFSGLSCGLYWPRFMPSAFFCSFAMSPLFEKREYSAQLAKPTLNSLIQFGLGIYVRFRLAFFDGVPYTNGIPHCIAAFTDATWLPSE